MGDGCGFLFADLRVIIPSFTVKNIYIGIMMKIEFISRGMRGSWECVGLTAWNWWGHVLWKCLSPSWSIFVKKVFFEAKYDDGLVFSDRLIRKCWGASGTLYVNTVLKPY